MSERKSRKKRPAGAICGAGMVKKMQKNQTSEKIEINTTNFVEIAFVSKKPKIKEQKRVKNGIKMKTMVEKKPKYPSKLSKTLDVNINL